MKLILRALISVGALALGAAFAPAQAANECAFSDLAGVTVTDCAGFYEGNLISGNAGDVAFVNNVLLAEFGVTNVGSWTEKLDSLSGSVLDFSAPLSGDTLVGIHFGNADNFDPKFKGGGTAFYRFDAGDSLDSFTTTLQGLSNSALYLTTFTSPIPEPQTYALMLAGLGLVVFMARRRKI